MKILILGAKGLIGRSLLIQFIVNGLNVKGTIRDIRDKELFLPNLHNNLEISGEIKCDYELKELLIKSKPSVVINCLGITKHVSSEFKSHQLIEVNSQIPHYLSFLSEKMGFRLINFGTDCIFSGEKGDYKEKDISDAKDLYGKSKYLGEINDQKNVLTLRTSFIGHSAQSNLGLIDWFLSSKGTVKGYTKAIYTGLPTIEIGNFLMDKVLKNEQLNGLFNLSGPKISKYDLLKLVKEIYNLDIKLLHDSEVEIDRSLDSSLLRSKTGYNPPSWEISILNMYKDFTK